MIDEHTQELLWLLVGHEVRRLFESDEFLLGRPKLVIVGNDREQSADDRESDIPYSPTRGL